MKKILGISLVAVLAVAPLMAHADETVTYTSPSAIAAAESGLASNGNNVVTASSGKYYAGKQIASTDANKVATGAYVKGAYNAAISAINKVAADTATALDGKQAALSTGDGIKIETETDQTTGVTTNTISVKTTDKKGLVFDGTNKTLEINKGDGLGFNSTTGALEVGLSSNKGLGFDATNKTLEVKTGAGIKTTENGVEVNLKQNGGLATDETGHLYVDGAGNFATKDGVVNTIKSSYVTAVTDATLSGNGVTALTTWGSDDATTTLGAAELVVTRQNVGVNVANGGTAQDPVYYQATTPTTITASPQTKTTPGDGQTTPTWTSQS